MLRAALVCVAVSASVPAVARADEPGVVGTITLQGRDAVDVVIRAPYRDARSTESRTSNVQIVDAIDKALREHTVLFAREAKETKNLLDAKGDTIAILKAVRTDVDLARLEREGKQIEDHNRERRALGEHPARFLVVITVVPQADKSRVSVVLVDADEGLALLLHDGGRSSPEELDQRFQSDAVIGRPAPALVRDEAETASYLAQMFTRDLRRILENEGVWDELGTIDVMTNANDAEIRLDGFLVGTTRPGVTRLRDAPLGPHRLDLAATGYLPFETSVQVAAGRTEHVDATMEASGGMPELVRDATLWSGVSLGVVGAVFTVWGAVLTNAEGTKYICGQCGGPSWVRLTRSTEVEPGSLVTLDPDVVAGGGVAMIPFGYSTLLTGAVWTLGPILLEDDTSEIPWVSLVVGLAAGALAYGISEAAESPTVPH